MGEVVDFTAYRVLREVGPDFPVYVVLDGKSVMVDTPEELLDLLAFICDAAPESTGLNTSGEIDGP